MDLETENRLAAMLMEEARRLRLQSEKEGVHAYLKPNVRARPNSRFLTATVLGVQQANRAVEVSEMWRARDKEVELDSRLQDRPKDSSRSRLEKHHNGHVEGRLKSRHEKNDRVSSSRLKSRHEENDRVSASGLKSRHEENDKVSASLCLSSKRAHEDFYLSEDGMQDEEIEKFLHSRRKRGRGAVGSRMDEPGPYLSTLLNDNERVLLSADVREQEEWEKRIVGPEKPSFMQTKENLNYSHNLTDSEDDMLLSKKHHVKKHSSKKDKSKKKKRKEGRSKHHNKNQKIR